MVDRILHDFRKLLAALIGFSVAVIVLIAFSPAWAGIGLLGFQLLLWLNTGEWSSFSLTDGVDLIAADLGFLNQLKEPSGIGESLSNFLNLIPLSSFLIIVGLASSAAVAYTYDGVRDRRRAGKEKPSESDYMPGHVPSAATRLLLHYPIQGDHRISPPQHYPPRINEPSSNPLVENQASRN